LLDSNLCLLRFYFRLLRFYFRLLKL